MIPRGEAPHFSRVLRETHHILLLKPEYYGLPLSREAETAEVATVNDQYKKYNS